MFAAIGLLMASLVSGQWGGNGFSLDADAAEVCIEAGSSAEALEFCLVPDGGEFEYYAFRVEKTGARSAKFLSEFGGIEPEPYGPIWEAEVKAESSGRWTARLSIPIRAFDMTRANVWKTTWKVNAVAYAKDGVSTWTGGAKPKDGGDKEFLKSFRAVDGFPQRPAKDDLHVKSATAVVTGMKDGKPSGRIKLQVVCTWAGDLTCETSWSPAKPASIPFGGGEIVADAVFPGAGRHQTRIRLVRSGDGAVFERDYPLYVDFRPIDLKLTKPQYRDNFYPGQNADSVEGRVSSCSGEPVELTLEGPGFARRTLRLDKGGPFRFDTAGFADGDATLTAVAGKEKLVRRIRKLPPLPKGRRMSWIENGNLVVDGRPTFRRNIYAHGFMGGPAFDERFRATEFFLTTNIRTLADLDLRNFDRKVYATETKFDRRPSQRVLDWIDAQVDRVQASDGVCYYITDEPECTGMSPVYLRHIYERIAERDPYHVVFCCSRGGAAYVDIADWFETHPYINPHVGPDGKRAYLRDFKDLGGYIDAFEPERHPDKCFGGTPTCFAYTGGDYPTFDEYVLNYWCEIVRGAKTMYPYAYHDLGDRPALFEGTRYMFESLKALEDVLLLGRRETLARNDRYECARWTMPSGDRMFAFVNFTAEPVEAKAKGLVGKYREFRGTRVFESPKSVRLRPHESLIACEKTRDAGLKPLAEVRKEIAAADHRRTHRGNQLAGRHEEMDVRTSVGRRGAWRDDAVKVFDGTLDVIAWCDRRGWGEERFFEMSFLKFVPRFREIAVYGRNIDDYAVRIRESGEWKTLKPVSSDHSGDCLRLKFDAEYSTVKMRVDFPKRHVEVYEIELPGKAREIAAKAALPPPKGVHWTIETPAEFTTNVFWQVDLQPKPSFLAFRLGKVPRVNDKNYTNWVLDLQGYGDLCGTVYGANPGLYTLRLPAVRPDLPNPKMMVYNYNLRFGMGDLVCCDLPSDCAELVEKDGFYRVRVKLSSPCEDMVCSFYEERGQGPGAFRLKGDVNTVDMRPVNAAKTLWEGRGEKLPVPADQKRKPFPFVRVNVLGGALADPIYTWLAR